MFLLVPSGGGEQGVNLTILPTISPPPYEEYAKVAVEEGVRIFETAGNNRALSFYLSCRTLCSWKGV